MSSPPADSDSYHDAELRIGYISTLPSASQEPTGALLLTRYAEADTFISYRTRWTNTTQEPKPDLPPPPAPVRVRSL